MAYPPFGLKKSMAARHTKVQDSNPRMRTSAIHNNRMCMIFKISMSLEPFFNLFSIFILTMAWVCV